MRFAVPAILVSVAIARPAFGQILLWETSRLEAECPPARDSLRLFRDTLLHGTVAGEVTNRDTGQPLREAHIGLTPGNHRATTDSLGAFTIDHVPEGPYQVFIRYMGFAEYKDTIRLDARVGTRLHVPLVPSYGHRCPLVRRFPVFPPIPQIPPPKPPNGR